MTISFALPWDILPADEKALFAVVQAQVSSEHLRYHRNCKVRMFVHTMALIMKYCQRTENNAWIRYLACGVCPISGGLVINARVLSLLLRKSKSSINGLFAAAGFSTAPMSAVAIQEVRSCMGCISDANMRAWTKRVFVGAKRTMSNNQPKQVERLSSDGQYVPDDDLWWEFGD
jgi:hypothetical protein